MRTTNKQPRPLPVYAATLLAWLSGAVTVLANAQFNPTYSTDHPSSSHHAVSFAGAFLPGTNVATEIFHCRCSGDSPYWCGVDESFANSGDGHFTFQQFQVNPPKPAGQFLNSLWRSRADCVLHLCRQRYGNTRDCRPVDTIPSGHFAVVSAPASSNSYSGLSLDERQSAHSARTSSDQQHTIGQSENSSNRLGGSASVEGKVPLFAKGRASVSYDRTWGRQDTAQATSGASNSATRSNNDRAVDQVAISQAALKTWARAHDPLDAQADALMACVRLGGIQCNVERVYTTGGYKRATPNLIGDLAMRDATVDIGLIESLLHHGLPLTAKALHGAVRHNRRDLVNLLAGALDVNAPDEIGRTALWHALDVANAHDYEMARLMLANGANINQRTSQSVPPHFVYPSVDDSNLDHVRLSLLDSSLLAGNLHNARFLLENGANTSQFPYPSSYHYTAAADARDAIELLSGHIPRDQTDLLLRAGDLDGNTPLHIAAIASKAETIGLLLELGADNAAVNNAGETPGALAFAHCRPRPVLNVLDRQADPPVADCPEQDRVHPVENYDSPAR